MGSFSPRAGVKRGRAEREPTHASAATERRPALLDGRAKVMSIDRSPD
jgi:hypothetical protein